MSVVVKHQASALWNSGNKTAARKVLRQIPSCYMRAQMSEWVGDAVAALQDQREWLNALHPKDPDRGWVLLEAWRRARRLQIHWDAKEYVCQIWKFCDMAPRDPARLILRCSIMAHTHPRLALIILQRFQTTYRVCVQLQNMWAIARWRALYNQQLYDLAEAALKKCSKLTPRLTYVYCKTLARRALSAEPCNESHTCVAIKSMMRCTDVYYGRGMKWVAMLYAALGKHDDATRGIRYYLVWVKIGTAYHSRARRRAKFMTAMEHYRAYYKISMRQLTLEEDQKFIATMKWANTQTSLFIHSK